MAPRRPTDGPGWPPDGPKRAQDAPEMVQDTSKAGLQKIMKSSFFYWFLVTLIFDTFQIEEVMEVMLELNWSST